MSAKLEGGLRTKNIFKRSAKDHPLLTVITVVFNGRQTLEQTMRSVLEQTYQPLEYIIIDGGSTDGSLEIIRRYEDKIDYWVSEPDEGLYNAMNKGLLLAKGDWIHILNSDDFYLSSDRIERVMDFLKEPGDKFYYFSMFLQFANERRMAPRYSFNWWNHWQLFYSAYLHHPTLFVALRHYETVGVFDEGFKLAADHDLILRLCKRFQPVFAEMPVVVMRQSGVSSNNVEAGFAEFKLATIKNGLPGWMAEAIFRFKLWKHRGQKRMSRAVNG